MPQRQDMRFVNKTKEKNMSAKEYKQAEKTTHRKVGHASQPCFAKQPNPIKQGPVLRSPEIFWFFFHACIFCYFACLPIYASFCLSVFCSLHHLLSHTLTLPLTHSLCPLPLVASRLSKSMSPMPIVSSEMRSCPHRFDKSISFMCARFP